MKKRLFIIFSLFFVCLFANTKNIVAKEVSKLCEYNLSDYGIKFSFNLYSKNNDDDYVARYLTIEKDGVLINANVERFYTSTNEAHTDWTSFNSKTDCNKYIAYAEFSDGSMAFALFDDSTKDFVINKCALGKTGSNCTTYNNYYSVKVTDNYTSQGDPLKNKFVGNLTCGNSANDTEVVRFHESLPTFTSRMYDFLKILTPVIIIITGMLDIVKAVTAQKEDDMKKAQKKLINRLVAGAVVFLVFVIVETVINFVATDDVDNAIDCVNCFLNGAANCSTAPARN